MATYYVSDQNGSDGNNGTSPATPKKTLVSALALMSAAGDILYVGPGTYFHVVTHQINGSGTINNPKQIIGDTQAQYLTSDTPGEVILTATNSSTFVPNQNITGLNFSSDSYWHVKNLTFTGYTGTSGRGISCSNSLGVFIENCHFSHCYSGIYNGSTTSDVTTYNCSAIGCYYGYWGANAANCVALGCYIGFYRGYSYGCLAMGCSSAGYNLCYLDEYGSLTSDYGAVYNSTAIGCNGSFSSVAGQNNLSISSFTVGGFRMGNHDMIGCHSICDFYSYYDGESSGAGIFPNVNSGSALSTCYYSGYHSSANFSPDDVNFVPTQASGMLYTGYVGICNDIQHMLRSRPVPGTEYFYTGSTGLPYYTTQITGSIANRSEAFEAFVSGSGLRFSSNWLQDTYLPPAAYDTIGIPMDNLRNGKGFTDSNKLQGAFPGYQFPDSPVIDNTYVTGSDFGIKIEDYGGFALAANVSGSITASVSVKYNAGTPPKILLVDKLTNGQVVSASASGTGDQTGAWQTLTVTTDVGNPIDVVLLQTDNDPTSYVHFSNFDLNG